MYMYFISRTVWFKAKWTLVTRCYHQQQQYSTQHSVHSTYTCIPTVYLSITLLQYITIIMVLISQKFQFTISEQPSYHSFLYTKMKTVKPLPNGHIKILMLFVGLQERKLGKVCGCCVKLSLCVLRTCTPIKKGEPSLCSIIKPQRACAPRVTVVALCVCQLIA